jgi:predicted dinucleotide-binding enzyme
MKIGIIGAGKIGETAARLLVGAGHEVALSNSRGPGSLEAVVKDIGPAARAMTVADAARFGEVVLLAVPWRSPEALPPADTVAGKIVIDAMNPYAATGGIADLGGLTASEHTARRLPGARLVKAFNTIWFKHLAANGRKDVPAGDRHAIPVASDDQDAKRLVMGLIEDIGFGPVDNGGLAEGGVRQQPDGVLYNRPMSADDARRVIGG